MITRDDVERFLSEFHTKMKVFGVFFLDDREKNYQTLADLEITATYRKKVLGELVAEDYSEGPILDALYSMGLMWVFGKVVMGKEVYIKITLGRPGSTTICISFHQAEYRMHYPLKQ